jgi:hypothetical protein
MSAYKKYCGKLQKNNEEMEKIVNKLTDELLKSRLKLKEVETKNLFN